MSWRIGKALQIFGRPSPSPEPIVLAEIKCQRQYIGADAFISWIGEADQICRMNFSNIWGLHGIAYLKSQLDAPIYWAVITVRNIFTRLCIFVQTSPNNLAVASRNGNRFFTQKPHVQIANKLRSPQCRIEVPVSVSTHLIFSYHLPLGSAVTRWVFITIIRHVPWSTGCRN